MKLRIFIAVISLLFLSSTTKEGHYKYNYVFPQLQCTIGGKEEEVLGIYDFDVDSEGKIFIAERYNDQVVVYSSSGERLYAFGRKGKGPGEFLTPLRICVYGDKVYVVDNGNKRIQILTKKGDYISSFKFPTMRAGIWRIDATGDRLCLLSALQFLPTKGEEYGGFIWSFWLSDLNGNDMNKFLTYTTFLKFKPGGVAPLFFPAYNKVSKDKIFIVDNGENIRYRIFVYSSTGEKITEIERKYKLHKVPRAMKEYLEEYAKESMPELPAREVEVLPCKYVPAIRDIAIDGDKLLVRTWEEWWQATKREKSQRKRRYEIDVYSTDGEYLGQGVTNLNLQNAVFGENFVYEWTQIPPYYETVINVYKRTKQ